MSPGAVDEDGFDPLAAVAAHRAIDATLFDPVGFRVIEALARRCAAQQGDARRLMGRRVRALLAEHQAARAEAAARHGTAQSDAAARHGTAQALTAARSEASRAATANHCPARPSALAGLSELVDRLGRSPEVAEPAPVLPVAAVRPSNALRSELPSDAPPAVPLRALAAFKGTWSRLRAEQHLRQALAQVPAMAGPLNSSQVMSRALHAMRELSPAYLDAFLLHADTLLWLEHASGGGHVAASRPAPASNGGRRAATRAARRG